MVTQLASSPLAPAAWLTRGAGGAGGAAIGDGLYTGGGVATVRTVETGGFGFVTIGGGDTTGGGVCG